MASEVALPTFLAIPLELRQHIYMYLLTPVTADLTIRGFFIRAYYRYEFMSQQAKQVCVSILTVCKQITSEALPVLYSTSLWQCRCRIDSLASQIGMQNFGLIKRMYCDTDDLPCIVDSLTQDYLHEMLRRGSQEEVVVDMTAGERVQYRKGLVGSETGARLKFTGLEMLQVEGYQAMSLTSVGDSKARVEGLNLCRMAESILERHPSLVLLVQRDQKAGNGGMDAVDFTTGRVRWRFLRYERDVLDEEHIVDLPGMMALFQMLIEHDKKEGAHRRSSLPTGWTSTGVFQQYPYLAARLQG
ncbi:hypothetical protein H2198_002607 [Neophaeococcomyces mojaviensis]|uniref:Uncharacterized protein n=1 Tax=Neophaeococcomyces mojaviensis TaxID=3383035 RepID=A0ACC3ADK7_9EURO|nr:hypothetical protein H2198_002607 [Knufia sp. JES_112]